MAKVLGQTDRRSFGLMVIACEKVLGGFPKTFPAFVSQCLAVLVLCKWLLLQKRVPLEGSPNRSEQNFVSQSFEVTVAWIVVSMSTNTYH